MFARVENGEPADEPYLAEGITTEMDGSVEVPPDHVFLMGDNRGVSQDSRFYGPVPASTIEGYVRFSWGGNSSPFPPP